VTIDSWSGSRLPYGDDMVNLLVADGEDDLSEAERLRVLAPGGVLYMRVDDS